MKTTARRIIGILCCAAIIGFAGWAWKFWSRPTVLTIAVGPQGFDDAELIDAVARALAGAGSRVRLSVEQTSGPAESLQRLKQRQAQLAVVRNEGDVPDHARSIAILHSDPVVAVAPKGSKIKEFHDLADKKVGLVGPPGTYAALMEKLRLHYHGQFKSLEIPATAVDMAGAISAKKVDALLFVAPSTRSVVISNGSVVVRKLTGKSMDFVSIDDSEAIAASAPVYEDGEISAGLFGGSPPTPAEAVSTLLVSTNLVADERIRAEVVTALTRFLFENRQRFGADAPVATLIKAASTDKDAIIPVHKGAKVFYDGEEQTLMEQYGDWLYAGPVILGAIASVLMAAWRFLGFSRGEQKPLLATVPDLIATIRNAETLEDLGAIRARIDAAVERISLDAVDGKLAEANVGATAVAIGYLDRLLRERRVSLEQISG